MEMRIKMARWWVRLGGKTGSHVTLAEVYNKVFYKTLYATHILYRTANRKSIKKNVENGKNLENPQIVCV